MRHHAEEKDKRESALSSYVSAGCAPGSQDENWQATAQRHYGLISLVLKAQRATLCTIAGSQAEQDLTKSADRRLRHRPSRQMLQRPGVPGDAPVRTTRGPSCTLSRAWHRSERRTMPELLRETFRSNEEASSTLWRSSYPRSVRGDGVRHALEEQCTTYRSWVSN